MAMDLEQFGQGRPLRTAVSAAPGTGAPVELLLLSDTATLAAMPRIRSALTGEEVVRASRFVRAVDRDTYIASHGALRLLLALHSGDEPRRIQLVSGANGKPMMAQSAPRRVEFNLSHSGSKALIALSRSQPVGVDIERFDNRTDIEAIAGRYFSPEQRQALRTARRGQRLRTFFSLWTRKEACLKARGVGLTGLDAPRPDPLSRDGGPKPERWQTLSLDVGEGYAAAFAGPAPIGEWRMRELGRAQIDRWPT